MKLIIVCLLFFTVAFFAPAIAQPVTYTVANAHSHNDYNQLCPYFQAYNEEFGSMEADIHLRKEGLIVGHDSANLLMQNTLQALYLAPLSKSIAANGGTVYKDKRRKLQLLIDIKTAPVSTIKALVSLLQKYPAIIQNKTVRIVITGNRPDASLYKKYPAFIWFDGNANKIYSKNELAKIAMLSEDFGAHTHWNGNGQLPDSARGILSDMVSRAHAANKPIRFWGCADFANVWTTMEQLGVDYLNTDHIELLADFLGQHNH